MSVIPVCARPNVIFFANRRYLYGRAIYMDVTWQLDVEGCSRRAYRYELGRDLNDSRFRTHSPG